MKQQRIISLDLIRTIAILLVIMQHAWTGLQLDEPLAGWGRFPYHALVVMGVPLFFMLSGALMLDARILPIRQFLGRRFKRLLLPYLLWGTAIYVLSAAMHKYPEVCSVSDALRCYIPYLLSGSINASYWYLFVLIGLYLLTPFLQRALSAPHARRLIEYALVLWGVWILLRAYYPQFGSVHYYSASGFMYLGFFLAGHYCVKYLTDERRNRLVGTVGLLIAYALNVWGLSTGINVSPLHAIAVVSLFLVLKSLPASHGLGAFVCSSGRYTYVIYFVHVPIVSLLCMLPVWSWCPVWLCPVVIMTISYVVSYLIAFCLDRLRFIPNSWVGI